MELAIPSTVAVANVIIGSIDHRDGCNHTTGQVKGTKSQSMESCHLSSSGARQIGVVTGNSRTQNTSLHFAAIHTLRIETKLDCSS
jgi:hypothetical protein